MIYFLQAGLGGLIKIGYTKSSLTFNNRLKSIKLGNGAVRLYLLGKIAGGRDREAECHHSWETYRQAGEWFFPGMYLMRFIWTISRQYPYNEEPVRFVSDYEYSNSAIQFRSLRTGLLGEMKPDYAVLGGDIESHDNGIRDKVFDVMYGKCDYVLPYDRVKIERVADSFDRT